MPKKRSSRRASSKKKSATNGDDVVDNNSTGRSSKRRLVFGNVADDDADAGGHTTTAATTAAAATTTTTTGEAKPPANKKQRKSPGIESFAGFTSPAPKGTSSTRSRAAAAAVTPEDDKEKKHEGDEEDEERQKKSSLAKYIPTYIHKNVGYCREGEVTSKLSETARNVYSLICEYYNVPETLEQERCYGPLSGTCYEERVIQQYTLGQLTPKAHTKEDTKRMKKENAGVTAAAMIDICTCCAKLGHQRYDCPTLI